jgi:hypothetical protein
MNPLLEKSTPTRQGFEVFVGSVTCLRSLLGRLTLLRSVSCARPYRVPDRNDTTLARLFV